MIHGCPDCAPSMPCQRHEATDTEREQAIRERRRMEAVAMVARIGNRQVREWSDRDLDEIEAQIDDTVPYYVLSLVQAVRDARRRAESAELALAAATEQIKAMGR